MTKDKVITLLNNNNVYFNCAESDLGGYVIDFILSDGYFLLMFDEDQVILNLIEIRGDIPNKETSTHAGLMMGDTYEKMIRLYGKDYTVYMTENYDNIYEYSLDDHYLLVYFLYDIVYQWGISLEKYENTYHTASEVSSNPEISSPIPIQNNDADLEKFYGEWKVVKEITPPGIVSDKTSEDRKMMIGQFITYSEDEVIANGHSVIPMYEVQHMTIYDFTLSYKTLPELIGLNDNEIITIEVYSNEYGGVWPDVGGFVFWKDEDTLITWNSGVFLEMKRVDNTKVESLNNLDQWIGEYIFTESSPPEKVLSYGLNIYKENEVYYGEIYIDGFQTMTRIRTIISGDENSIDLIFEEYLPDNSYEPYNKGDLMLTLKMDSDKILTSWGEIKPMRDENLNSGIYFEKET
jgi:hypothetical protein